MLKSKLQNTYPNFFNIISFLGLFLLLSIVLGVAASSLGVFVEDYFEVDDMFDAVSYVMVILIMIAVASAYRSKKNIDVKYLKLFRKHNPTSPAYVLYGIIAIIAITFVINPLVSKFTTDLGYIYDIMINMGVYMSITCVIVAPVLEEMLFRGIVQTDLEQKYGKVRSIFLSSMIFALVHINPAQVISVFFVSLVLGVIYFKTKSLWTVIIIHSFNNTASFMLFKLCRNEEEFAKPYADYFQDETLYYTLYGVAFLVVAFTIYKIFTAKDKSFDKEQGASRDELSQNEVLKNNLQENNEQDLD